ncbi:hypothetical protein ACFV7R_45415 [Streptomyces sp. NPDC059866]|uniref:hypothetical protein n=1 Tax=Streptomyces sp. NPDC059866 TaxID=3346978 RepID=UPI00365502CA
MSTPQPSSPRSALRGCGPAATQPCGCAGPWPRSVPAASGTAVCKRFWRHDEVAAFFAQRAPKKHALPAAVLEADQKELLTKRETDLR